MIVKNIYELIGNTPIIKIETTSEMADVFLKLEWFNPGGSVKDRIAISMIEAAEKTGILKKGDTIVEPTSGNTGIGLAMVAAAKGYKLIITMPDSVSTERVKIMEGYGAKVVLTDRTLGMKESIRLALEYVEQYGYFMPMQFENINNPKAHMKYTSQEILKDVPGITHFLAGVGTGGTITGVGTILKELNNDIKIIAVEPTGSPVLSGGAPGPHKIQGIGAGFIPKIVNTELIDEIMLVEDQEAYDMARVLAKENGIFAGISTGANVSAALKLAKRIGKGNTIVTVSPSNAERYLSTDLFE